MLSVINMMKIVLSECFMFPSSTDYRHYGKDEILADAVDIVKSQLWKLLRTNNLLLRLFLLMMT